MGPSVREHILEINENFQTHGFDESEENLLQSKNDVHTLEKKDRRGSMIPVATTNGTVLSKFSIVKGPFTEFTSVLISRTLVRGIITKNREDL